MSEFNHFDDNGNAIMVDVSSKDTTNRTAIASGRIYVDKDIIYAVNSHSIKKGDVLGVARIGGIMALKKNAELIPMCHTILITHSSINYNINEEENYIEAICTVKSEGKTGVEMEALTGVSVCLLTIYDMCKAISKRMHIENIHLIEKTGGKSGDFYY